MTDYQISRLVLESRHTVEIGKAEFDEIVASRSQLFDGLATEETYDLLIGNYVEWEQDMTALALENLVYSSRDWSATMDQLQRLNRRLLNLLSACRLYLDHLPQRLAIVLGSGAPEIERAREITHEQYDLLLGYRVLEGIRNYIQHRNLPVRNISWNSDRMEQNDGGFVWRNVVTPRLDVAQLVEDKGLKPAVLEDLRRIGTAVDLKPLVREYVQGLGLVHAHVRAHVLPVMARVRTVFLAVVDRWESSGGEDDLIGLSVVRRDEGGQFVEKVAVFLEPLDRYLALTQKNHRTAGLARHYVSTEAISQGNRA